MLESLTELVSSSPWTYAIIFAIAALDAVFPLAPSEATVIAAGVLAGVGELSLALVIAAGATGALARDSTSYAFGRTARRRLDVRPVRAAGRFLKGRGGLLVVVARFVPGRANRGHARSRDGDDTVAVRALAASRASSGRRMQA